MDKKQKEILFELAREASVEARGNLLCDSSYTKGCFDGMYFEVIKILTRLDLLDEFNQWEYGIYERD